MGLSAREERVSSMSNIAGLSGWLFQLALDLDQPAIVLVTH